LLKERGRGSEESTGKIKLYFVVNPRQWGINEMEDVRKKSADVS